MADEQVGEAWARGWKQWLKANLPAELAGFEVVEATEDGERPERCVIVGLTDGVERVPGQPTTGRVHGAIALKEPAGAATDPQTSLQEHREKVKALWALLKTVTGKPENLIPGIFLHDIRWEDREMVIREDDRYTAFPVSNMATAKVTV